jgi:hypothetical protein
LLRLELARDRDLAAGDAEDRGELKRKAIVMAISANTVWEVRTTGSDNNGGGFVAGASGTDYSQQDSAQYSGTDLMVDTVTNTKVTSASHSFVAADVGNILRITAGTGYTAGAYQIVSVASSAATLDRSPGATGITGGSYIVGGALASPGMASSFKVANNTIYIKSGTYSISTTSFNVSGGKIYDNSGATWEGYGSTRGDLGTAPVLQAGVINISNLFEAAANTVIVRNLISDANNKANSGYCFYSGSGRVTLYKCVAKNWPTGSSAGFYLVSNGGLLISCIATGGASGSGGGFNINAAAVLIACESYSNACIGFNSISSGAVLIDCLSYSNTGASTDGFSILGNSCITNCVAYGNGRDGFRITSTTAGTGLLNCIAEGNAGWGFSGGGSTRPLVALFNCAGYNNTSGNVDTTNLTGTNSGFQTLTGSPFVATASNNFALNKTAGAGALCRATGMPGIFPRGMTTGYLDIGAAQSAPGGSYGGGFA